jgi:hypothetical protein
MRLVLSAANSPAVGKLANLLWSLLDDNAIQSNQPWPFDPYSLDLSSLGLCTIQVTCKGAVSLAFTGTGGGLVLSGTLDLTKLENILTPNYIDTENATDQGPLQRSGSTQQPSRRRVVASSTSRRSSTAPSRRRIW